MKLSMEEKTSDSGSESFSTFDLDNSRNDISTSFSDSGTSFNSAHEKIAEIHFANTSNNGKNSLGDHGSEAVHHRNVRFSESTSFDSIEKSVQDLGSGAELIQVLRERLTHLQVDLQAERTLRKRKDKNLIKLAKELNRRSTSVQEKDVKIKEMETTVRELEFKIEKSQRESSEQIQAELSKSRAHGIRILELDGIVSELRKQLLDSHMEAECLRSKLTAKVMVCHDDPLSKEEDLSLTSVETSATNTDCLQSENRSSSHSSSRASSWSLFIGTILLIMLPIGFATIGSDWDSFCGPVLPGTVLVPGTKSYEAPWWVPMENSKESIFSAVCGDRPRTKMSWKGNKLFIYKLSVSDKKSLPIVWQRKAPLGVQVRSNSISVNTNQGSKTWKAPWSG